MAFAPLAPKARCQSGVTLPSLIQHGGNTRPKKAQLHNSQLHRSPKASTQEPPWTLYMVFTKYATILVLTGTELGQQSY
jgi:hypothetical protein